MVVFFGNAKIGKPEANFRNGNHAKEALANQWLPTQTAGTTRGKL
jgi:hypothetical protein